MPDRLLHRTWSVRTIGPFARALCVGGPRPMPGAGGASRSGGLPAQTMASTSSARAGPSQNEEETERRIEGEWEIFFSVY